MKPKPIRYSKFMLYLRCQMAYYIEEILNYELDTQSEAITVGQCIHTWLQGDIDGFSSAYNDLHNTISIETRVKLNAILNVLKDQEIYSEMNENTDWIKEYAKQNNELGISCHYDFYNTKKKYFLELKTSFQPNNYLFGEPAMLQFAWYFLTDPELQKMIVYTILKPSLRLRRSENILEYQERLEKEISSNAKKYFRSQVYTREDVLNWGLFPYLTHFIKEVKKELSTKKVFLPTGIAHNCSYYNQLCKYYNFCWR